MMFFEINRRAFDRLPVDLIGTAYFDNNSVEIRIDNISEEGIGFTANTEPIVGDMEFEVGDILTIQFVDKYRYYSEEFVMIETVAGKIVQIREVDDGLYIGCNVTADYCEEEKYENFVTYVGRRRKVGFVDITRTVY